MTRYDSIGERLRKTDTMYLVPPNINALMTGTRHAYQSPDRSITLVYEDGSEERRENGPDIESFESYFACVDWVQEGRKN